ncbi:TetR family transcriptional regulator [Mycobacterium sp. CBMA247]|nr:TetR family transcriptional regulator [Mycolicibacterium sp. CBMA 329]MUL88009.1 TetR family transcriptional regulator [Mycolicibacterium sp. CBMA 331]MUM02340.1 TetR family transcriptional regulator [Mycolicibacterium sp. CBMA 334]MUM26348.1 TetR family transcriptional regulator [Mycolicibacterium sp. CBMA 295]MUM38306.1 TetR family transcriptional regulator [Mycolicibacterium sp. CBMA 247]MUM44074.1 TetR family transcriptional regulator [Mycolicibacterium sp. CBMA 294]
MLLRREEIIDAMVEQISARGIAATRVADVASAMGVSTGLIFYHFETKEALLAAAFPRAMQHDMDDLAKILARKSTASVRLRALIKLYSPAGAAPGWRLWIDGWAAALRDPGLVQAMRDIDNVWRTAVHELIVEGNEAGEFRCRAPEVSAARITALLDGLAVQRVVRGTGPTATERTRWVNEVLEFELQSG